MMCRFALDVHEEAYSRLCCECFVLVVVAESRIVCLSDSCPPPIKHL